MIEAFRVQVSSETIIDLRDRLRATRWPGGVSDSGGVPLSEMRDIARYWLEEFDWPAREHDINRLPHFRAELDGLRLHYIHIKSGRPDARPLLLLHGWPGSFVEMLSIVPILTESFHVVVPSLPGYGFSDAPSSAGMSNERTRRHSHREHGSSVRTTSFTGQTCRRAGTLPRSRRPSGLPPT